MNSTAKLLAIKKCLDDLNQVVGTSRELESPVSFDVMSEGSDPHKTYYLHVTVSPVSIRIETAEDDKSERVVAEYSWDDLVRLESIRSLIDEEQRYLSELRTESRLSGSISVVPFELKKQSPA